MIGQDDAVSALESIERTRQRAFELRGYAHAGDIVMGWGVVWLVCNLITYFAPEATFAWPVGIPLAVIWSIWRGRGQGKGGWRAPATAGAIFALVAMVIAITQVETPAEANALITAFVATGYVIQGIWIGQRFAWIGLAIAACVGVAWFIDREHLELWLGIGGGGALILSGLWLKRA